MLNDLICSQSEDELPGSQVLNAKKVSADCTMVDGLFGSAIKVQNNAADLKNKNAIEKSRYIPMTTQ